MFQKLRYLKYYTKKLFRNWFTVEKSYSQHGEDLLIRSIIPDGVSSFIDIGANDGVLFSNSYKFAKSGAHGLCIEPSGSTFFKLRLNHLFHYKVKCLKGAVSKNNGMLHLIDKGYESTLSSVSFKKSKYSKKIKSFTFDEILKKFPFFTNIDLLSVDVEGHEKEVFEGLTNSKFYVKAIILETDKHDINNLLLMPALSDYRSIYTNGLNTILIHKSEKLNEPEKLPKGFISY